MRRLSLKEITTAPDSRCRALLCEACRPLNPAQRLIAFGRTLIGAQEPLDGDANVAACREGDTLVVTTLDRLARSLPDARAIAEDLTQRQVRLNLGGSVYDPTDPVGRLLFNVLAMVAEFETDLIRLRTREG